MKEYPVGSTVKEHDKSHCSSVKSGYRRQTSAPGAEIFEEFQETLRQERAGPSKLS